MTLRTTIAHGTRVVVDRVVRPGPAVPLSMWFRRGSARATGLPLVRWGRAILYNVSNLNENRNLPKAHGNKFEKIGATEVCVVFSLSGYPVAVAGRIQYEGCTRHVRICHGSTRGGRVISN